MVYGKVPSKNYSPKFFGHTHTLPTPSLPCLQILSHQGSVHHLINSIYHIHSWRQHTRYNVASPINLEILTEASEDQTYLRVNFPEKYQQR